LGRQVQSGLGLLFMILALIEMLEQLDSVMTHQLGPSGLLVKFVVDVFVFVLGFALFRSGRGKSVRIDALWKR
jgi:hypothetical protein